MHILIVEDDEATAAYIHKGLTEAGHTVDTAREGDQGLEMATRGQYDTLIVDRMLPTNEPNVREVIVSGLQKAGAPKG